MDDLISRQQAIDALEKIFPADPMRNDYTQGITVGAALATEYIKQLPPAQSERPTGHWIKVDDAYNRISGRCSKCGWVSHLYEDDVVGMNYCPNCGADMRGEQNE